MKVIKSTISTYNNTKEMVENEIKTLKCCSHKNIVQFIDVFEKKISLEIHICILLEYVDGYTLKELNDFASSSRFKETTIKGFIV